VVSSTYHDVPSTGTSIGASMIARMAANRNPALLRQLAGQYPEIHIDPNPPAQPLNLDGRPGTSFEELFLASRSFRGTVNEPDRPAQISSDVNRTAYGLERGFPLTLPFSTDEYRDMEKQTVDDNMRDENLVCRQDSPYRNIQELARQMRQLAARSATSRSANAMLQRMLASYGFQSVEQVQDLLQNFVRRRQVDYEEWRPAARELSASRLALVQAGGGEVLTRLKNIDKEARINQLKIDGLEGELEHPEPGADLADLRLRLVAERARLEQRQRERADLRAEALANPNFREQFARYDTAEQRYRAIDERTSGSLNAGADYSRIEKAYYFMQYMNQRETTHNDPKATACSSFNM
jgi:hypothetical protein